MSYPDQQPKPPALDAAPAAPPQPDAGPAPAGTGLTAQQMEGLYAGLDKMPDALPVEHRAQLDELLATSVDPNGDKALFANVGYLADAYHKDPAEVAANVDAYRANYAQQMGWGDAGDDDGKFYAKVGQHYQTMKQERALVAEAQGKLFEAFSTGGDNWRQPFTAALAEMKGKPGFDAKRLDIYRTIADQQWKAWTAAGQHYPAVVDAVQHYFTLARTGTGTEQQQVEARAGALRALQSVPEQDQDSVLGLAQRGLPEKGGASMVEKAANRLETGVADTAQKGLTGLRDLAQLVVPGVLGHAPLFADQASRRPERKLDNALAGHVDPNTADGWLAKGVLGAAEGLPRMMAMFTGPGIAVNLGAFSEEARGHFEDAGVPPEKAAALGPLAAIPLTGLMAINSQVLLGKVGSTAFEGWLGANLAGKAGADLVAGYAKNMLATGVVDAAALGTMTAGQMLTEPALQTVANLMDKTIPGVQWSGKDGEFAKLAGATPETLAGLVPLIVLGAGMGTLRSREFARNTVQNEAALRAVGLPDATVKEMLATTPEHAEQLLQDAWDKRTPNPAAVEALNGEAHPAAGQDVSLAPDGTYLVKDASGAVVDQAATAEGAAQAAQEHAASNVVQFPGAEPTPADLARMHAMEAGQIDQGGPELLDWIKGKLPRPEDAKLLQGELRGLYENLGKEVNVVQQNAGDAARAGKAQRGGYTATNTSAANAFFAKKGTHVDLDHLTDEARAAGFNFDTPADLLTAVDNSMRGNLTHAMQTESSQAFGIAAGGGRIGAVLNSQLTKARQLVREISALPVFKGFHEVLNRWVGDTQIGIMHTEADVRQVVDALPDDLTRRAVGRWLDAGGDKGNLRSWLEASTRLSAKKEYEAALKLTPAQVKVAEGIRQWFNERFRRAVEAGIMDEKQFRDTYLTQLIERPFVQGGDNSKFGGQLNKNFKYSQERVFPNLFELEQAGFDAKTTDVAEIMARYDSALNKAILTRQLVKDLLAAKNEQGQPLAVPLKGSIKPGEGEAPNFISNPRQKTVDQVQEQVDKLTERARKLRASIADNTDFQARFDAADELKGIVEEIKALRAEQSDAEALLYKSIDHPSLRKYWWIGKDPATGKETFMEGDIGVHPEIRTHLENALGTSGVRRWYDSQGNALTSVPKRVVKAIDVSNGFLKRNLLGGLSLFHAVHEYKRALGNRVAVKPWALPEIDPANERVKLQVRTGLMLAAPHDVTKLYDFSQGLGEGGSLVDRVPGIGKLSRGVSEYTFHKLIPALKSEVWNHVYDRNLETFRSAIATGEATHTQVAYLTSQQINARFGHLNLSDIGRNPTLQHLWQIGLLAPDFIESNLRNYGQDAKGLLGAKTGREPAVALAATAAVLWLTSRVLNKALDDNYHFDEPFAVVADGRVYTMRNEAEDLVRMWKSMRQYVMGRLSPTSQAAEEFLSGRNWRGEKIGTGEVFKDWLAKVLPMALRFLPGLKQATDALESGGGRTVSVFQQFLGSLGVQVGRHSPLNDAYRLANDYKKAQGVKEDTGTYPVSKYQQLRYALEDGNADRAKEELAKLREGGANLARLSLGFHESLFSPWTKNERMDREFKDSLTPADLAKVQKAEAHRQQLWQQFLALREQVQN